VFGKWLKEQRLNLGLTQQELANLLGLTKQTIYELEVSRHTAGLNALKKISDFFGVSIYELRKLMEEN
jgi:transcriptional regulator with XRE-family HTH domain